MDAISALAPTQATAGHAAAGKKADKARAAAEAFESFFIYQLMESMGAGIKADGPLGGGASEKTWRSMQNEQYGKIVAGRGGIGLADIVHKQILHLQEAAQATP